MEHRGRSMIERGGLALVALVVVTLAAWMAGWAWLAVPGAFGVLGIAAATVGTDSRSAGDWKRVDPR